MDAVPMIILPDAEEPEAAEVLVDGKVSDQPYRFLLDTGAARSRVVHDALTADFERVGQNHSSGVFSTSASDLVRAPSITIGPLHQDNMTVVREESGRAYLRPLIGMDLLKKHRCLFSFRQRLLWIDPPHDVCGITADLPLHLDDHFHPAIDLLLGGQPVRALWDTGAGMTVADAAFLTENARLFTAAGLSHGTDASGMEQETGMALLAKLTIGGEAFGRKTAALVDLSRIHAASGPVEMIVGYNIMHRADWLFDFPGRKWGLRTID